MSIIYGLAKIKSTNKVSNFVFEDNDLKLYNIHYITDPEKEYLFDIDIKSNIKYSDIVTGFDFDDYKYVVFFIKHIPNELDILSFDLVCYIILKERTDAFNISKMKFSFNELNYFFPVEKFTDSSGLFNKDSIDLKIYTGDKSKENFSFTYQRKKINCELGIDHSITFSAPFLLKSNSYLLCQFNETKNIDFIISIFWIWYSFFILLFYRQNINMGKVKLIDKNNNCIGKLFITRNNELESEKELKLFDIVNFYMLKDHISDLIQLFSDKNVYVEHLPIDKNSSHHVTIGGFILNMAAFEWTYKLLYGKEKTPLRTRLKKAFNNNKEILLSYIEYIYRINKLKTDEKTIDNVIQGLISQRNIYAHGDIKGRLSDYFIINNAIIKLLNHFMIFKKAGYAENNIIPILEKTFHISLRQQTDNQILQTTKTK